MSLIPVILAAAAATYIPRLLPFLTRSLNALPKKLSRVLRLMPVAALGSLIFPGVILDFQPAALAGIVGIAAAAIISLFKGNMILSILGSIAATCICWNLII